VPHGRWKTTTFICGLRYDGVTAPFVLDVPIGVGVLLSLPGLCSVKARTVEQIWSAIASFIKGVCKEE
jgi:hypothetical protein